MHPHPKSFRPWLRAAIIMWIVYALWLPVRVYFRLPLFPWMWWEIGMQLFGMACIGVSVWHLYRWHQYSRGRHVCQKCGYDLTASRERCPECGGKIPQSSVPLHRP